MDSVSRHYLSNASTRADLPRDCAPQSKSQYQCWEEIENLGPPTQAISVTLPSWLRLWLRTARIRLNYKSSAKCLRVFKLVLVGVLAATQVDRVREIFTVLELLRLICVARALPFPPSTNGTTCRETTKDTRSLEYHEGLQTFGTHEKTFSKWEKEFSKDRKFQDVQFFAVKELKINRDDLDCFLDRNPSSIPSWKIECIRKFCSRNSQSRLETGGSSRGPDVLPRAWVDSRVRRHGLLEINTDKLCAPALQSILKETVRSALLSSHHTEAN